MLPWMLPVISNSLLNKLLSSRKKKIVADFTDKREKWLTIKAKFRYMPKESLASYINEYIHYVPAAILHEFNLN